MRTWAFPCCLIALAVPATVGAAPDTVVYTGMCDASAAVVLDAKTFAVADDEDNILRVYDVDKGGPPLRLVDLSPMLPLHAGKKAKAKPPKPGKTPKIPETDLEAATALGDAAYWLTSHGRNSKGKRQTARLMFFSTNLPRPAQPVAIIGSPYRPSSTICSPPSRCAPSTSPRLRNGRPRSPGAEHRGAHGDAG